MMRVPLANPERERTSCSEPESIAKSRNKETRSNQSKFQIETERGGAEVRAGWHMSSASEFPERRDWLKKPADLADNDSENFWNVLKNSASNGEWEEGGKRPNWLFEEFCNKAKIYFSTKYGRLF